MQTLATETACEHALLERMHIWITVPASRVVLLSACMLITKHIDAWHNAALCLTIMLILLSGSVSIIVQADTSQIIVLKHVCQCVHLSGPSLEKNTTILASHCALRGNSLILLTDASAAQHVPIVLSQITLRPAASNTAKTLGLFGSSTFQVE
jgi:hypothetical protein